MDDDLARALRDLEAERRRPMPPDYRNKRRDLFEEVERARMGVPPEIVARAQALIDEVDEWEAGRVRQHLQAVSA